MSPTPATLSSGEQACSSCGKFFSRDDLATFGEHVVCAACQPAWIQSYRQGMSSAEAPKEIHYAGFWIRVLSQIIDIIVLFVFQVFLGMAVALLISIPSGTARVPNDIRLLLQAVGLLVSFGYYTFCWANFGATAGKKILGLKVINQYGGPVRPGQAIKRWFSQLLSGILFGYGYMRAGWSPEKETLHDNIAETRVIYSR